MTILANTITQEIKSKLVALEKHCHDVMTLGTFGTAKELLDGINVRLDEQVAENNRFIAAQREQENLLHKNVDTLIAENQQLKSVMPPSCPMIEIVEHQTKSTMEEKVNKLLARGFKFQAPIDFTINNGYRCIMTFTPVPESPKTINRTTMGTLPKTEDKPTGWQNRANGIGVYVDGQWQLQYRRCVDITAYWQSIATPAINLLNSHRYPLVKWGYNATTFGPFIEGQIEADNPNSFGKPNTIDSNMWARFCKWLASILNGDFEIRDKDAWFVGALNPTWGQGTDWIGISDYAGVTKSVIRRTIIDHDLWKKTAKVLAIQLNQIWADRSPNRKYVWESSQRDIRAHDRENHKVFVLLEKPQWLDDEDWRRLAEEVQFKLTKLENREI